MSDSPSKLESAATRGKILIEMHNRLLPPFRARFPPMMSVQAIAAIISKEIWMGIPYPTPAQGENARRVMDMILERVRTEVLAMLEQKPEGEDS